MKKLMLLGGMRYLLPVIEVAHKMGIYVITCDYLPDNIAHRYSDQYCNVSIIDKNAVLEKAREFKIDGIMSFACDPGVETAAYVAEKLKLPSCGPYKSVCILQNKAKFRQFLKEHNFNVPTAKGYKEINEALKDVNLFNWPVIVKPTDSAGSKGVTRVDNPDELKKSIQYALSFSHSNEFIIEDFLEKSGYSSDCDSFSIDGELKFISFSSQRFDENCENPYTPSAYSWPTTISNEHQEELKNEIQRLLKLLDMKTSVYNIETRECNNGKAYIMECSPRGGGNRLSEMIKYCTGIDLISNSIKAALGKKTEDIYQKNINGYWAEIIIHSNKTGIFEQLNISKEIDKNIIEKDLWIEKGTEVGGFSGANEAIGTIILRFNSNAELEEVLANQNKYIEVVTK